MSQKMISTRRVVIQELEALEQAGVTHLPKGRVAEIVAAATSVDAPVARPAVAAAPQAAVAPAASSGAQQDLPKPSLTSAGNATLAPAEALQQLDVIRAEVAACTRCHELATTRTQTVFGVGNPRAKLCFMGEAPGADEDRQGEPFVGRAGQLLTKIIEACRLKREDVFILNALKCRPPENRVPAQDEVANCRGYFERQLEIIRPEYICCLGGVAAQALLETDQPIGKLRRRFHDYRGITVVCTYHPAYLLRNPNAKRDVWDDMKMLFQHMGVEL